MVIKPYESCHCVEKVVQQFDTFPSAEETDEDDYCNLSGNDF